MVYGKPPFFDIQGMKKIITIANAGHKISFPVNAPPCSNNPALVQVLQSCLRYNGSERPSIPDLLEHEFLNPTAALKKQSVIAQDAALTKKQLQSLVEQLFSAAGKTQMLNVTFVEVKIIANFLIIAGYCQANARWKRSKFEKLLESTSSKDYRHANINSAQQEGGNAISFDCIATQISPFER